MKYMMFLLFCSLYCFAEAGQGMQALDNAAREDKYLYIFLYKDQNERTARAQKVFDIAMQKLNDQARAIKIKINDPSESALIEKFNLKRTPVPFVLVLAPNGAVTGGFPSNFNEGQLTGAITTRGVAQSLKALQDRKLAMLSLQNPNTQNNAAAMRGVQDFKDDPHFGSATEVIVIDPADAREQPFLKQLGVDVQSAQAQTVLIAPPSTVVGIYSGATSKEKFAADMQKATSGCCCPGGCCPGGCCSGGCCN